MNLPDWLPPAVHEFVLREEKEERQGQYDVRAVVRRIATSEKMKSVWRRLKKRGASDDQLREFMVYACVAAATRPLMTRKERDARVKPYADAAKLCREVLNPPDHLPGEWRRQLSRSAGPKLAAASSVMADYFERSARMMMILPGSPWVVENHIKDDAARAFVQTFGQHTKDIFGDVMYDNVATVAAVALNRKITQKQVRNWCDARLKPPPASLCR
jgi:hypothetical protein